MKNRLNNFSIKQTIVPIFSLFTSMGTLVCCALPALLVSIGAGATLAGIVTDIPWLVSLSKYKAITFGFSGLMIIIAGMVLWYSRNLPCPTDPKKAKTCMRLRRFSLWVYWISILIWLIGFFFAFVAVYVFY